ncbi:MAG: hypothetical protein WC803_12940 [Sphingomonas sp.]|jgi:hypothetical protein
MELKDLITIFYCSSNREKPEFEQRIIDNIRKHCGDLPIISVTQKPIDFGTNICVGDTVGVSGFNFFKQSLIALQNIKTPFALSCEADTVYPPDYFTFVPERLDMCYRDKNLFVMGQHRNYFYKKEEGATHAQIVGTEFYRKTLEKLFEGEPEWDYNEEQKNFPKEKFHKKGEDVFKKEEIAFYETENPVVQIKTSQSMRHHTHSSRVPIYSLPFWGSGMDFRKKFYELSTGEKH